MEHEDGMPDGDGLVPHPNSDDALDAKTLQVLALLSCVVFVAVVNGTMINVALPHIGREFGASEGLYGWLVTGYSLAFGIFSAVNGRLADIWGKRRVYMMGLVALGACSIAVSVSPSLELAIALRTLQGAGAAALPVLGTTIIKTVVPPSRRGWAIGVILSTVGVAASLGPFLGGVLVQFVSWRAVFLVPGVILLLLPVAMRILPRSLDARQDTGFDVIGALLMGVGIAALVYSGSTLKDGLLSWAPLQWAGVTTDSHEDVVGRLR
ncbi:MAG: MFS transporter, partial [Myxococcota bacterium]